jgi:exopolyphosphatase/guanosine-5'-triphosphate,3'-diphosphate pyrophosphatase
MARATYDQGRFGELEPIAVVDIGSNSVRLVVYEGAVRSPFPLFNEKILCGLGRSMTNDDRLAPDSVARTLAALRRFRAICRTLRAKNIQVIATAAVRDASDGKQFIAQAEEAIGARIQILTGEREAELAANGIRMGFIEPDGICGDLGGGSLELINIAAAEVADATTLPLGGLRLIARSKGRLATASAEVESDLAGVSWLRKGRNRPFYAIGGTWRTLAKLHMEITSAPLRVMHGYQVKRAQMIEFCDWIATPSSTAELPAFKRISRSRRETLPYGALVLRDLLNKLRPSTVNFSIYGIREGLLYSFLSAAERAKDPLLSFCEDFARLRSRSYAHARELCSWTDHLFETVGIAETPAERRLRHAACLLSDIEWRTQPDHRGELSLYVLAHAPATGLDHDDRLFVALAVYFRHAGRGDARGNEPSAHLRNCVTKRLLHRAQVVAAAVRTAHMLSIGMPGIIDDIRVRFIDGCLRLVVPRAYAALDGERLQRRFAALGTLLKSEAVESVAVDIA